MEEASAETVDILDRRGRLVRLAISGAVALVVTVALVWAIGGVAREPNADAISQVSPALLGMGIFAVTASLVNAALVWFGRRRAQA